MRTVLRELKKVRGWLFAGLLMALLNAGGDLYMPAVLAAIVDQGILSGNRDYLNRMVILMLCISVLVAGIKYFKNICAIETGNGYAKHMRSALFRQVNRLSPCDVEKLGAATLITNTTNDVTQIANTVDAFIRMMVRIPITCAGGLILAFALDWQLALVILAVVPVIAALSIYMLTSTMPLFRRIQNALDRFNQILREKLSGIRVIRAFNRTAFEEERIDRVNSELAGTTTEVERKIGLLNPLMTMLVNLTVLTMVGYAVLRARSGAAGVGVLIACIQYANQILSAIVQTSMLFSRIPRALVSARRIERVMQLVPSVQDPAKSEQPQGSLLEFHHVSYRFSGAQEDTLHDLCFSVRPGETTAIIGATGSGKTTILNLIERFSDCTAGEITLGGVDLRAMTQQELRRHIGLIPQKAFLFSGSLRENLQTGAPGATEDDLRSALETAQATEFTDAFPEGMAHQISAAGTNLSGGQKQRLAIARALVRKPSLYLFDDSFSALDFRTDALLRQALRRVVGGAAVLIVAQRVGTILDADNILVLENGCIAGQGTHTQLMKTCRVYQEIVSSQLDKFER